MVGMFFTFLKMEIPGEPTQVETFLQKIGFERLYRWKIGHEKYFIQICPKKQHICILTSSIVYPLLKSKISSTACIECRGELWSQVDNNLMLIADHDHLLNLLFALIVAHPNCQISRSVQTTGRLKEKYNEYKHIRDKHFREKISDDKGEVPSVEKQLRFCKLYQVNQNYMQLIIRLEQENHQLRDKILLLEELLDEKVSV